jgi:hypothetical protein
MKTFWKGALTLVMVNLSFMIFVVMLYALGIRINLWEAVRTMLIMLNGCILIAILICVCIYKIWG